MHRPKPATPAQNAIHGVLDSDGGGLAGIRQALADLGWHRESLRTFLEYRLKFYADYGNALRSRDEVECLREAYTKLRVQQLHATAMVLLVGARCTP